MATTLLFIDADNQPPILASTITRFLKAIGRKSVKAFVTGNGIGDRVRHWESALKEAVPEIEISCHIAPLRKQSADVRLMFELATFYHGEPDPTVLLAVFSRDDLLVAATESLVQRGHNAMIVIGAGSNGLSLNTDVPVVVLTTPQQGNSQPTSIPAPPAPVAAQPANKSESQLVLAAVTKIRQQLKPNKQGGYAASAVGQVLAQMGHDKTTRTRIVKQIPNLKEVGAGSEKRLIF